MTKNLIRVCLALLALSFIKCDDEADIFTLDREFEIQEDELITINLEGEDEAYIEVQVMEMIAVIRAGARGYVTKTIGGADLAAAVHRVAEGDAVFSPRLAGFVLDAFGAAAGEVAEVDEELDRLSTREREVMRLIARGYQYKEVAKELFISVKTVETHVSSVLRKLQLSSRHELTAWAMDRRLL